MAAINYPNIQHPFFNGSITYPDSVNYMSSPFDPEGWYGATTTDGGIITNVTISNPSGEGFAGLAEQNATGLFFLLNSGKIPSVLTGEAVYSGVIYKIANYPATLQYYLGSDQSSSRENTTFDLTNKSVNLGGNFTNYKFTDLSDEWVLLEVEYTTDMDLTNVSQVFVMREGANLTPPIGSQLYVQAAYFGKTGKFQGSISYPNATNYISNSLDPETWSGPDPDGSIVNITTENPSGETFAGLVSITSGNLTFITTFSNFDMVAGEKEHLCLIVKNVDANKLFIRFQSDAGTTGFQTQIDLQAMTKDIGDGVLKTTPLSDGYTLVEVEYTALTDLTNCDILVYANGDSSQLYVQAAYFGKSDTWPALVTPPDENQFPALYTPPVYLDEPLLDGSLSWSEFNQRRAVARWSGPPITTPNVDDAPAVYNVTVLCRTKTQLDAFVDFYKTTLNYGSEWFNMNLMAAGQVFNQEVNFLGTKPGVTQVDALYMVNMNLTTRIAFRDTQEVTDRALQYLTDGYKYISELPVSDITIDSTLVTIDSTIITIDATTNPFY